MEYRCVATSVEGFVQQLAVAYVTHGYWFYVLGQVPEHKAPVAVDRKLIKRYGIAISKWARCRRKKLGLANMQYLRHERFFVLLATKGRHEFFEREAAAIRDIRRVPIKFAGYSIGCRKGLDGRWHASVRINGDRYGTLKAYLSAHLWYRGASTLMRELQRLPFEPYAPVRRQLLSLLRLTNRLRTEASLETLSGRVFDLRRATVRVFDVRRPG